MLLRCPSRGQPDADRAAGFPLWDAEVATADGGGTGGGRPEGLQCPPLALLVTEAWCPHRGSLLPHCERS